MKIYMVINETDFGPFFSTLQKALDYLNEDLEDEEARINTLEELRNNPNGYPDIEEITLDDKKVVMDR